MAAPETDVQRERFNCRVDGQKDAPVLVLSNSLGTNLALWDAQMPELSGRFRVLRYDSRGHGASAVTPGPYTIAQLGRDVLVLMDRLKIPRAHFCGLSIGGMVGMWLAVHAPRRIDRLVLCNTSPRVGPAQLWNTRIENVRKGGIAAIADAVLERWFTAAFRERAPDTVATMRATLIATPVDGYIAACAAVRDIDQWQSIGAIKRPTLVIAGTHDAATPAADGRKMAQTIAQAQYAELDAAHISNVEAASTFTAAVTDFLAQ